MYIYICYFYFVDLPNLGYFKYHAKVLKIIQHNLKIESNQSLKSFIVFLIKNSYFTSDFLSDKSFGCFGKQIELDYVLKDQDRVEIFDNLKMSPNDKRKHNFKKN